MQEMFLAHKKCHKNILNTPMDGMLFTKRYDLEICCLNWWQNMCFKYMFLCKWLAENIVYWAIILSVFKKRLKYIKFKCSSVFHFGRNWNFVRSLGNEPKFTKDGKLFAQNIRVCPTVRRARQVLSFKYFKCVFVN